MSPETQNSYLFESIEGDKTGYIITTNHAQRLIIHTEDVEFFITHLLSALATLTKLRYLYLSKFCKL